MVPLKGVCFVAGTHEYAIDDLVNHEESIYLCRQSHSHLWERDAAGAEPDIRVSRGGGRQAGAVAAAAAQKAPEAGAGKWVKSIGGGRR